MYNFVKTFVKFYLFSSDTLQELMLVVHTVSELRFYGCDHPYLWKIKSKSGAGICKAIHLLTRTNLSIRSVTFFVYASFVY